MLSSGIDDAGAEKKIKVLMDAMSPESQAINFGLIFLIHQSL